jgi:hypothetical protein
MEAFMNSLPVRLLVNGIAGAVAGAIILGLFALLVAGLDGIVNGVVLGLVFGFVAGVSVPAYVQGAYWWQGIVYRFGRWWQKRQSGEENDNGI